MTALVAAAPPSPTLFARMAELNFRVVHVYGLTETYGPITVAPWLPDWDDAAGRRAGARCAPARARRTRPPTSCAWSTSDDADVPRDGETMGEVVMRGNNVMRGYFDDDEATATRVPRRLVPLRRPRGVASRRQRSSCATAPRTSSSRAARTSRRSRSSRRVVSHPAVLECAVVAIPHERWGERPKAFVTLQRGRRGDGGGADRALPRAPRALQVPGRRRVRAAAEDVDRQGAEVRAARPRVGRPRRRASTDVVALPRSRDRCAGRARSRPAVCGDGGGDDDDVPTGAARSSRRSHPSSSTRAPGSSTVTTAAPRASSSTSSPVTVGGAQVQLHFRRLLATRRWQCSFHEPRCRRALRLLLPPRGRLARREHRRSRRLHARGAGERP